jgi:hypothetical protein
VFFTALGYKREYDSNPSLVKYILGGILWATGESK